MARVLRKWIKDPNATLDYTIKWDRYLKGDVITSSIWVVPSPLVQEFASFLATSTSILVSGGTTGHTYTLTNRITTRQGRTDDRSIQLVVTDT